MSRVYNFTFRVYSNETNQRKRPSPRKRLLSSCPHSPGVEHRFAITQKDAQGPKKKEVGKRLEAGASQAESVF